MEVNKIIQQACTFLGREDLKVSPILLGEVDEDTERVEELELLLKCVNYTLVKIATYYKPLTAQVVADAKNQISLAAIDESILNILSVKDSNDCSVEYKIVGNKIICSNVGRVTITYSYYPKEVTFGDVCNNYLEGVHEQMIALGVVSDYYFMKGMTDEMQTYDAEFHNVMKYITRKKSEIYIKPRRWR